MFPDDLASDVEAAATTGGTIAASVAPVAATCGDPIAVVIVPDSSRNGAKFNHTEKRNNILEEKKKKTNRKIVFQFS